MARAPPPRKPKRAIICRGKWLVEDATPDFFCETYDDTNSNGNAAAESASGNDGHDLKYAGVWFCEFALRERTSSRRCVVAKNGFNPVE